MMFSQARTAASWLIGIIAALAAVVSLGQSYRGLLDWAVHHAMIPQPWASVWPLMVDTFLVVGELWLLITAIDQAGWQERVWAWLITGMGLAASVAGNIGHVGFDAPPAVRWSAAVPPLAAAAALAVTLRLVEGAAKAEATSAQAAEQATARAPARSPKPVIDKDRNGRPYRRRARLEWMNDPKVAEEIEKLRSIRAAGGEMPTDRKLASAAGITRYAAGVLIKSIESEPRHGYVSTT